ncbi:MAG TPA: RecX family transcriptional regulator [Candidatus Saccharimonadales bacterium]
MSEITDIKQQQKREDRFSVYVDGKYSFSLARDQLAQFGLKTGRQLALKEIEQLKDSSSFGKLRDLTYKWLSLRPHSEHEIDEYLKRKAKDETQISKIKEELKLYNYIDDSKFARSWIAGRSAVKPRSKYRLKQELMQKRVPKEIIEEGLKAAGLDDMEAVKEVIAKRRHRYKDEQKLIAYLARQGFNYDVIKRALNEED